MRVALPDCREHRETFTLTPEERRELVRRIAEHGPDAIDAFIREREQEDSLIARKVAKLREELMRRAQDLRERLAEAFREKEAQLEAEYHARLATLQNERDLAASELERLPAATDARLAAALRANPVLGLALDRDVARRAPWWRRALAWLAKALRALLWPLVALLRLFAGRRARSPERDQVALAVPGAGALLASAGDLYLADGDFRRAVRERMRAAPPAERIRHAWERLLGREDYETLARRAMAAMLAEEADRAKSTERDARAAMEARLARLTQEEARARGDTEVARREAAAQRERDAAALEEALRTMPEAEVKEAVVDELRAAGLLRQGEGGLVPTLQFMDAFAALVHDEELGTAGGAREAPVGDYAEGEGHYRRGPLRSAMETGRMDILASVLRARTRHQSRHALTEDDVVVHREERSGSLRVVLVVDRSGSMEDNGRMDAAKRAALALHHAVKARNRRNKVDVFLMDTSVAPATLRDVWEADPRGFTNHGAALRLAREACQRDRAARTLVYVVTDGLPEAYTKDGEDVAGHPEKAMAFAKAQARLLSRERNLVGFVMLLLEPRDEMFVEAARALAEVAGGRVVPVDPAELTRTLVRQLEAPPARPVA